MSHALHHQQVEPEFVPLTFLTGVHMVEENGLVFFTGWQDIDGEKRIVVRTALSVPIVRKMVDDLRKVLPMQN